MRKFTTALLLCVFTVLGSNLHAQCTYTQSGQLSSTINFSSIIDCSNGDVTLNGMNSHPSGSGKVIFDSDVTLNSLEINFDSGNKPVEFIIPAGVTVIITTDLDFNGQPDKDKFLTVEGTLIVGGTLDFGGLEFEIDGTGTIDAGDITGADDVGCVASGTCPNITSDTCDDGGGDFCDTALPVSLAYFGVTHTDSGVLCSWITASEENNDFFQIEKSYDGVSYEVIGEVDGAGNSTETLKYQFLDGTPTFGQVYYRLKQVDFDGANETFKAKSIYVSLLSDVAISPNPVAAGGKLTIYNTADKSELVSLKVYNASGVAVIRQQIESGVIEMEINEELHPGLYVLKVESGNKSIIKRLIIK